MTIKIHEAKSNWKGHIGPSFAWSGDEKQRWLSQVHEALDVLRSNRASAGLVSALEVSKNEVGIVRCADSDKRNVTWIQGTTAQTYRNLDAATLNHALKLASANGCPEARLRGWIDSHAAEVTWKEGEMAVERVAFNGASQQIVQSHLEVYDALEPAGGVSCMVRWHPDVEFLGDPAKLDAAHSSNRWRQRPAWVGLGHELIHAWRFVEGRNIFYDQRALDEDLTVGVLRFRNRANVSVIDMTAGKYTENAIRFVAGLPARPYYGNECG